MFRVFWSVNTPSITGDQQTQLGKNEKYQRYNKRSSKNDSNTLSVPVLVVFNILCNFKYLQECDFSTNTIFEKIVYKNVCAHLYQKYLSKVSKRLPPSFLLLQYNLNRYNSGLVLKPCSSEPEIESNVRVAGVQKCLTIVNILKCNLNLESDEH